MRKLIEKWKRKRKTAKIQKLSGEDWLGYETMVHFEKKNETKRKKLLKR